MKYLSLISTTIVMVLFASIAHAQVATSGDKFGWDQTTAATLTQANQSTVDIEIDGIVVQAGAPIVCTGAASPFVCTTAIPAIKPGSHSVRLKFNESINGQVLSSAFSTAFAFSMRAVPSPPSGIRIV